jgi:hypothetical protein
MLIPLPGTFFEGVVVVELCQIGSAMDFSHHKTNNIRSRMKMLTHAFLYFFAP